MLKLFEAFDLRQKLDIRNERVIRGEWYTLFWTNSQTDRELFLFSFSFLKELNSGRICCWCRILHFPKYLVGKNRFYRVQALSDIIYRSHLQQVFMTDFQCPVIGFYVYFPYLLLDINHCSKLLATQYIVNSCHCLKNLRLTQYIVNSCHCLKNLRLTQYIVNSCHCLKNLKMTQYIVNSCHCLKNLRLTPFIVNNCHCLKNLRMTFSCYCLKNLRLTQYIVNSCHCLKKLRLSQYIVNSCHCLKKLRLAQYIVYNSMS